MYCKKCGHEIEDGAKLCPECNTPVPSIAKTASSQKTSKGREAEQLAADEAKASQEPSAEASAGKAQAVAGEAPENEEAKRDTVGDEPEAKEPSGAQSAPPDDKGVVTEPIGSRGQSAGTLPVQQVEERPEPQPKRTRKVVAGVAVAAAVVIAAVGAFGLGSLKSAEDAKANAQAEWNASHTSRITQVVAKTPGFDEKATAIPVEIKGKDLDGNTISEVQYLRPDSMQIETLPGSYDVSFPGGYFTGEGKVVKAPEITQHIVVDVLAVQGASGSREAGTASAVKEQGNNRYGTAVSDEAPSASVSASASAASSAAAQTEEQAGSSSSAAPSAEASESASSSAEAASQSASAGQRTDAPDGEAHLSTLKAVEYVEVSDLEVTEELLASIAKWAGEDPKDGGKAEQLQQAATTNHQTAVQEEQARNAQAAANATAQATQAEQAAAAEARADAAQSAAEAAAAQATAEAPQPATQTPAPAASAPAPENTSQQQQQQQEVQQPAEETDTTDYSGGRQRMTVG